MGCRPCRPSTGATCSHWTCTGRRSSRPPRQRRCLPPSGQDPQRSGLQEGDRAVRERTATRNGADYKTERTTTWSGLEHGVDYNRERTTTGSGLQQGTERTATRSGLKQGSDYNTERTTTRSGEDYNREGTTTRD